MRAVLITLLPILALYLIALGLYYCARELATLRRLVHLLIVERQHQKGHRHGPE